MVRAFLVSLAVAVFGVIIVVYFGLFKNDGFLAGNELIIVAFGAGLCGLIYGLISAGLNARLGHVIGGALIASSFPILVFLAPTAFCIGFLPHASCM